MLLSLKIALSSLRAHRLRTVLAMVGVFLGALALTGVQHVSKSMRLKAELETAKLGTNLFVARTGQVHFRRSGSARVRNEARNFTVRDAEALMENLPAVRGGAPFVARTMKIRAGDIKIPSQVVATLPSYEKVRNLSLLVGRFFDGGEERERARVCVLGHKIAERLFGSAEAALGRRVFLFRGGLRVVGVMEEKGADITGTDQDEQVFLPLSTYLRRFANQRWITGVYLHLADPGDHEATEEAAAALLRSRHAIGVGETDDFSLLSAKDSMKVQKEALDLVRTLGIISSTISFAVGGLGILSIMILLVRTRRLEIGVRRAVGARRRDIIRQFVLEAALMATAGGVLGVLAASALLLAVYRFGELPQVYDPLLILGTLGGSVLLGLAAGAYPAWQAARVEVLGVLKNNIE